MRVSMRFALPLLVIATTAFAQVNESITVSFVEVPVTVVDRSGAPVRGLTAANFEVVDEGKARPITTFDVVDFASTESLNATSALNPAARRNFLLVFDLTFSSPTSIGRAQDAARDFVSRMVEKRDRVGIATVDVQRGFRLLTNFTTDRKLVTAAIANPRTFQGHDPLQVAGNFPFKEDTSGGGGDAAKDAAVAEYNDLVRRANKMEDDYNRQKIDRQVNLLTTLISTLRAVSGQKHLVFLSEGFDPRLIQGRDAGSSSQQVEENAAVLSGEYWKVDSDNRYGSTTSLTLLDKMAQVARKADVIVDTVDIKGVRSDTDPSAGLSRRSNEGLHLLANATGGSTFKNSNDVAGEFQKVVKAREVVYVLGFQAPTTQPGKFHNLKVRLVNVPNGRVSHRSGYFEAGGENAVERTLTNAEIVLNDIAQSDIRVAALAASFPTGGENAQVPVILEIAGDDVLRAAKGNAATAEIFIYAFDDEGLVRDTLYQRMTLDLAKVSETLKKSGIKYYATLSLPPGNFAVKSLVNIVESNRKGFARQDVTVAKSGEVAISQPFFFEEPGKWLMIKGGSHAGSAPYPFEVNGESFIPSAAVHLPRGQTRKFALFVDNAAPDELAFETKPEAKLVSKLKSSSGSKLVFEVQPSSPKVSELSVTVRTRAGGDPRTATVPLIQ